MARIIDSLLYAYHDAATSAVVEGDKHRAKQHQRRANALHSIIVPAVKYHRTLRSTARPLHGHTVQPGLQGADALGNPQHGNG